MISVLLALLTLPVFVLLWGEKAAAEPIRLINSMALSPDGETLVFSYRNDLWIAKTEGGAATRLTFHPGTDSSPFFSPDGERLAFVSNRSGRNQTWVMRTSGGQPTQVTVHSEGARVAGWFPDGESLLIQSQRDHFWRGAQRFFKKSLDQVVAPQLIFNDYGSSGSLSPSGRLLGFSREGERWWRKGYQGPRASQVWTYDRTSKEFTRHSEGEHDERWPFFGPDDSTLYYVSEEDGTFNLWRRNLESGVKEQLTRFEDDGVAFPVANKNGDTIVFRRLFDLYRYDPTRDAPPVRIQLEDEGDPTLEATQRVAHTRVSDAAFTDDAREIAFVAGGDIWVMDTELREPKQVTRTPDEERDPVFSPDFESILFVSDRDGQPDIYRATREDEDLYWWQNDSFQISQMTNDPDPESDPRFTPDGERVSYLKLRGDLWSMDPDGGNAKKILSSWNQPEYAFSPDGKWVVYAVSDNDFNRDVWIHSVDGEREPYNLSRHPDNEGSPVWSPDGRMIAFAGRRYDTEVDVYYVWLQNEDEEKIKRDRTLEKALEKMKGRKKAKKEEPKAKQAGKKEDETAKKKTDSTSPKPASDPVTGSWDGKAVGPPPLPPAGFDFIAHLTHSDGKVTGSFDAQGASIAVESGLFDENTGSLTFSVGTPMGKANITGKVEKEEFTGTWTLLGTVTGTITATRRKEESGTAVASGTEGESDQAGEEDKEKKEEKEGVEVTIDFDGIEDRIHRISIPNSFESGLFFSHDSKKLAFRATVDTKRGIYTVEIPESLTPKLLTSLSGASPRWLKEGNQIAWVVSGAPSLLSSSGKNTTYAVKANQEIDLRAKNRAVFDLAWRTMRDQFYDDALGNRNWDAVRRKYRDMAGTCLTTLEISIVVNLMLGELNGSHLGFFATGGGPTLPRPAWGEVTPHFGVRFDESHRGPGLKVKDVIEGSPASQDRSRIHPGEVILRIEGKTLDPGLNLATVLSGPPRAEIELSVKDAEGETREVSIRPSTYGAARSLLYETWIRDNQKKASELSAGKLGYLHVRGMNWPSFQRFEAELYKVGHGKDGLIIDVRENGGGFTTDHLLTVLTQPLHAITVPRGGGQGYPLDRTVYARWNKPIIVLCNQNSYSNAEIFSHAIKNLNRGKVVGVQTAGGVISTGGTRIMDIGFLRLPFRGWYLANDGEDMELNGCMPHHVVWPKPEEWPNGIDRQLEKAVEVLLDDVAAWKAEPRPDLIRASTRE